MYCVPLGMSFFRMKPHECLRALRSADLFFLAGVISAPLHAQAISPTAELREQVGLRQRVPLPDAGLFGEQFNPLTGEMTLEQTDVSQETNGLPLSLMRSFTPGSAAFVSGADALGDWQWELPRITTFTVRYDDGHGWRVAGEQPYARCSAFGAPPLWNLGTRQARRPDMGVAPVSGPAPIKDPLSDGVVAPDVWWHGYQLRVPWAWIRRSCCWASIRYCWCCYRLLG